MNPPGSEMALTSFWFRMWKRHGRSRRSETAARRAPMAERRRGWAGSRATPKRAPTPRAPAPHRQAIGQGAFTLDLPAGTTPGQVWSTLAERYPDLRRFPPPARFAVNDEFVGPEHALAEQDEVALIPPVSGGGDGAGGAGGGGGAVPAEMPGGPA